MIGGQRVVGAVCSVAVVAMVAGTAAGQEKAAPEKGAAQVQPTPAAASAKSWVGESLDKCCWGGDVRIRQVYFDNIPIIADPPGVTREGINSFFRFRTRLWGQMNMTDEITTRVRLVNEFREYNHPDNTTMDWPDETVVDQLTVEVRNLLDGAFDLTVGRQDLIYGTGKLLLEGTPLDGSRTIYCDAVKLVYKGMADTTIDFLGIYNQAENDLVFSSEDRNLTGFHPADEQFTESGAAVYLKNKGIENVPFEAYYFFKNEESFVDRNEVQHPTVDVHTFGSRIMPKWNDQVDANVEVAYQFGERGEFDQDALMVDGIVNWHLPVMTSKKPTIGVGFYYLSGNDPETADDEGWNPLWARWPQYSELYVYAWDAEGAARWSNLSMPHVDLTIHPCAKSKLTALVGYLKANENDGPGDGDERGWLGTLRLDMTLAEGLMGEKDKLAGHLLAEVLDPGDYYKVDDTAYFLRWELSYAF